MLKVIVIVPETSLLVVSGCGLDWVASPNFSLGTSWVGLGQSIRGLDWARPKKMDPRTTVLGYVPPPLPTIYFFQLTSELHKV